MSSGEAKGLTLALTLAGQQRTLLVDSGSEVSILKRAIEGTPLWKPRVVATGVTGSTLSVEGEQEVECRLGGITVNHQFLIAHVNTIGDGLMGLDLMAKLGVIIDARGEKVVVDQASAGNSETLLEPSRENRNPTVVKVAKRVEIPAYSEKMIEGRLQNRIIGDVVVEPVQQAQLGVRLARSLNLPVKRQVWVSAINLTGESVLLGKGQTLGVAEPLHSYEVKESIKSVRTVGGGPVGKPGNLKERESELLDKLSHLPPPDREQILAVLTRYAGVFEEPDSSGCSLSTFHHIRTLEEGPIAKRPYRVPHNQKPIVAEHLQQMLQKGIIEPSQSPWSAPVVLVQKKAPDGSTKFRFCTDFRGLNQITKTDAYPIPLIVETLEALGRSRYFTTLDLSCGYHQIPIWPEDCEKTAFTTLGGALRV